MRSEAAPANLRLAGTTGVQVHGEFRRVLMELGRSLAGRPQKVKFNRKGVIAKSKIISAREVRWSHSSWEVG